jgi:4-amino-4-deoxy-L-arabinose transferase-like glycosyltransferase
MAWSMKIFEETIFSRIPSAIEGVLMVLFINRIGCNLKKAQTGYYGALFWAFAYYSLLLTSGAQVNDHNDMAFAFYLTASMWTFSEYVLYPGWKWATLTGIFAGLAFMVK